jgi:hypothetical protein
MAHKKLWHAMTNICVINSRHTKAYGVTKNHGFAMKICDTLLLNNMPCYHHIDNRVIIKHKEQQCLQLANK